MRIALVVPHIFMHQDILPNVIFSPGTLALDLANGLQASGAEVTLFTPGPVATEAHNVCADLSYFEAELAARNDTYIDLLKKHPMTFISLARQVQSEIIADVIHRANNDEFDVVHFYTNEEDTALPFSKLCKKPVVFTHHDPFNFLAKYRSVFPKYKYLNWLSISESQRKTMPSDTNWQANIYHGLDVDLYQPNYHTKNSYIAYIGRIIEPKGVHLAIQAIQKYNFTSPDAPVRLKIAGKHYSGSKDIYWQEQVAPNLKDPNIEYVGFLGDTAQKQEFLANASALVIPSTFDEPFGMVMTEALACATPVIGLDSGAISEVITHNTTGFVIPKNDQVVDNLANVIAKVSSLDRHNCRNDFEERFTLERMCREHLATYAKLQND